MTLGGRNSEAWDVVDIKRESRRIVLTGAEGLTFDDFFPMYNAPPRPAPKPPVSTMESPLDEINLRFSGLGISLDFPSPPHQSSCSSRRDQSPTPSESSTTTSSGSSSSSKMPMTPPTSDDESHPRTHLARAPTCKSHRASILYIKSMPDLKQSLPRQPAIQDSEEEWSDGEDASWLAQDISDIVTLSSPLHTPTSKSYSEQRARPDSIPPPPRHSGRGRQSKLVPVAPLSIQTPASRGPSAQLDPTFHTGRRRSRYIPSRPPPPPPVTIIEPCRSPTMEEKTDELLALLANAALDSNFLGSGLASDAEQFASTPVTPSSMFAITTPTATRPPPRMSIPADINDFIDDIPVTDVSDAGFDLIVTEPDEEHDRPMTPESISIYSQASMSMDALPTSPVSSFDFNIQTPTRSESPMAGMYQSPHFSSFTTAAADVASSSPTLSHEFDSTSMMRERNLRSRWSSSTLASEFHAHQHRQQLPLSPSAWITRFHLGSSSSSSPTKSRSPKPSKSGPKVPLSPAAKKSLDLDRGSGLTRRDSSSSSRTSSSDSASDSGESTSSSGLRRKAIPVELFMRA
ncbi:unnamed protein product [Somion occarium]